MNAGFKILFVSAAVFMAAACSKPKDQKIETVNSPVKSSDTTLAAVPENMPVIESITGVVTEVQPGKDGYTAKVKTTKHTDVYVTVSRVNLKNPDSYRSVKAGDTIQVIGEEWEMNDETHLKALQLK